MNLLEAERLAAQIIDVAPGSETENAIVDQVAAAFSSGASLQLLDPMFRMCARKLLEQLPPGIDMHSPEAGFYLGHDDSYDIGRVVAIVRCVSAYCCGDPDHALAALQEFFFHGKEHTDFTALTGDLICFIRDVYDQRVTLAVTAPEGDDK